VLGHRFFNVADRWFSLPGEIFFAPLQKWLHLFKKFFQHFLAGTSVPYFGKTGMGIFKKRFISKKWKFDF